MKKEITNKLADVFAEELYKPMTPEVLYTLSRQVESLLHQILRTGNFINTSEIKVTVEPRGNECVVMFSWMDLELENFIGSIFEDLVVCYDYLEFRGYDEQ